jgi:hypothetical protein
MSLALFPLLNLSTPVTVAALVVLGIGAARCVQCWVVRPRGLTSRKRSSEFQTPNNKIILLPSPPYRSSPQYPSSTILHLHRIAPSNPRVRLPVQTERQLVMSPVLR